MGAREDWIRGMGGNPARYRNLDLPPPIVSRPEDEFVQARCPARRPVPRERPRDPLQARATGAAPFGGGQPERPPMTECGETRARVLVRYSGLVRGYTLACTRCGHTWDVRY